MKQSTTIPRTPILHQGIAVPLAEGWAAKSFVAIAAPYARKKGRLSVLFERRTMKPLIASEAFVRALEELKSLAKLNPESLQWTPQDIFENIVQGKLSAGVTWPRNSLPARHRRNRGSKFTGPFASRK